MTRTIDAATVTALSSDSIRMANLIQMDFSPVVRITDWHRELSLLSETWESSGHILNISSATETAELRINSVSLTLSGVDQTFLSLFLNNNYHDIRVRRYKAFLDSSEAIIGAPVMVFDGRISDFGLDENEGQSNIEIVVASHWANYDAKNGRRSNHNSQQKHFPGDDGFEFAADTVEDIKWGRG